MIRNGVQYLLLNIEDIVSSLWKHKAVFKTRMDSNEICRRKMQKTSQTKNSSFNRINVVRIFKEMERALSKMSKYSLFEFNDAFTRNYLTSIIRPYLAGKKADRSIIDSLVVCDETNNTPQVIANNQLVCDIIIKPNYSAEWIILHFVNVGTNDFSIAVTGA